MPVSKKYRRPYIRRRTKTAEDLFRLSIRDDHRSYFTYHFDYPEMRLWLDKQRGIPTEETFNEENRDDSN